MTTPRARQERVWPAWLTVAALATVALVPVNDERPRGAEALAESPAPAVRHMPTPGSILIGIAQAAERPTAAAVREGIEGYIAEFLPPTFRMSGEITVVERGDAFDIVFPGVTIGDRKGGALDIGTIETIVRPQADGNFSVTATLPRTMGFRDKRGEIAAFMGIGDQRFKGVWSPTANVFVQFDTALNDIWINRPEMPPVARIGRLAIKGVTVETSPGEWNSPSVIRLGDLRVAREDGAGALTVGEIEVSSFIDGMRLEALREFSRQMMEALNRNADGGDTPGVDPLELLRTFDTLPSMFGDLSFETEIKAIAYRPATGPQMFGLDQVQQRFTVRDLDKRRSRVAFRYEHSGLEVSTGDGLRDSLIPSKVVVEIAASQLPTRLFWLAWLDWIKAATTSTADFAMSLLADRISSAALWAGSELRIERFAIDSTLFDVDIEGVVRADSNSLYNMTGEMEATVRGMERVVDAVAAMPSPDRKTMNVAAVLALVQALGAVESNENGTSVRRYHVVMPADGALLLNGNDIATILGVIEN